jgi:hypothetical protein
MLDVAREGAAAVAGRERAVVTSEAVHPTRAAGVSANSELPNFRV